MLLGVRVGLAPGIGVERQEQLDEVEEIHDVRNVFYNVDKGHDYPRGMYRDPMRSHSLDPVEYSIALQCEQAFQAFGDCVHVVDKHAAGIHGRVAAVEEHKKWMRKAAVV